MSIIRVNPESIQSYAQQSTQCLQQARADLDLLVRAIVEVRYEGPNATKFKTDCANIAVQFSMSMIQSFQQIAAAVQSSTSNISSSLGGAVVSIAVDGSPIAAPAVPAATGIVDVDTSGLEALPPVVTQRIQAVRDQLDSNLRMLEGTDWQGSAKETAVSTVTQITTSAKSKAVEAETSINQFIRTQVDSVVQADK
jgi:hypothetical protein